jgi:predicted small lipoprotein YifL
MRALFRSLLAVVALGTTMIGCNKSGPSGPPSDVTVFVPGMT